MNSLSYSRDRCILASNALDRAQQIAKPSKVSVELHCPDCYKISSWRGWHLLFWPGNALVIGYHIKHEFSKDARCSLLKLVEEVCKISMRERETDIPSFKKAKLYDQGPHIEDVNQEVKPRNGRPSQNPKRGTDQRVQRRFPGRRTG